jgi:hypothetical protein
VVRPPYWTVARVIAAAEPIGPAFDGAATLKGVDVRDLDPDRWFNTFVVWYQTTQLESDTARQAWLARIFAVPPEELQAATRASGGSSYEAAVAAGVPRRRSSIRKRKEPGEEVNAG